jgi:hypothetical protein
MSTEPKPTTYEAFAPVIVKLLQGAVYDDNQKVWNDLLQYQFEVSQYFEKIAVELIVERQDGYAYIRQIPIDEENNTIGLVRRMPLSYELSLLCVLLRMLIDDFEVSNTDQRNLYISHKRLKEELEIFFKEQSHKVRMLKELDRYIDQAEGLGFLKVIDKDTKVKDEIQYEVRRIIKARITNDKLEEFKRKLQQDV